MRILVFQTAFLGDAILSIPLLKTLRWHFPDGKIGFVCRKGVGGIFDHNDMVHQVIEVDKNDSDSLKNAFRSTREFKADLIVSPHRSFRTALWVFRLGAATTVGFKDWWTRFSYKKSTPWPATKHDVLRQLSLLEGLGIDIAKIPEELLSLKIELPPNEKFSHLKDFVALSPGSQWNTKRWTQNGFVEVAEKLRATGNRIVLVGAPAEEALCREVAQRIPGAVNLCGQTSILELGQVLSQAGLLVCNDSGAMHVAAAVGTPVLAVFGATVPAQGYSPWRIKSEIVQVDLSCRPCGAHGHDECPLGHHDCMKKVTPEMVLQAAGELLS